MRTKLIAILILLGGGLGLHPLETRIHAARQELRYGTPAVTLAVRDQVRQNAAFALLVGFRALVADFIWIQSQEYWEKRQWDRQYRNMELATTLQPQSLAFWDVGAWHLAWNIGYAAQTDPANLTQAQGLKRQQEWQERAREFLERGLANNPNRYDLYFAMGWLLWRKFEDPCRAATWFQQASTFADAPSYTGRLYAHALERCGRPEDAYEYWKRLWRQGNPEPFKDGINARGVIERELRRLERELAVPADQRVFPAPGSNPATTTTT